MRGLSKTAFVFALVACGGAVEEFAPVDSSEDGGEIHSIEIGPARDAGQSNETDSSLDAAEDAADTADAWARDASTDSGEDSGISFPAATMVSGAADRILLRGIVVTPTTAFDGEVLVEGPMITCAKAGTACSLAPGALGATIITTNGVIAPGLIDTHNHILFDIFDGADWLPSKVYTNHEDWPAEPRYQAMLDTKQCLEDASQGKPLWCPATYDGAGSLKCEMDKWGELKGMIAGTTSIVGLAGTTSACFGSLARSIDAAQNGLGSDKIQTSALFPPSKTSADGVCTNFASLKTSAYLVHCGEGTDAKALAEFGKLGALTSTATCLYAPQTVVTHGTAFTSAEFTQMARAGMKLTWSPASNVALYGTTTNIPAALDANVLVTLAPDWSMGGSQNLLDEMRFADTWDNTHFGNRLTSRDIVAMATSNAATALGLRNQIGALEEGLIADLMVVSPLKADPFDTILSARPADVRLTMIGGRILYGDAALKMAAPPLPGCEDLTICNSPKFVCVAEGSASSKLNQTYAEIKSALEAALVDVDAITASDGFNFAPLAPLDSCK